MRLCAVLLCSCQRNPRFCATAGPTILSSWDDYNECSSRKNDDKNQEEKEKCPSLNANQLADSEVGRSVTFGGSAQSIPT